MARERTLENMLAELEIAASVSSYRLLAPVSARTLLGHLKNFLFADQIGNSAAAVEIPEVF